MYPVSILHKSIAGHYRPVSIADGPITARCRFMKNASWVPCPTVKAFSPLLSTVLPAQQVPRSDSTVLQADLSLYWSYINPSPAEPR